MSEWIPCPACGSENGPDAPACAVCGYRLDQPPRSSSKCARCGSGLGEAVARELARLGAKVTIFDMNAQGAQRVAGEQLQQLVANADLILDCSDNFSTRHAVNAACVVHRKPLVSGAAIGFDGQISVYDTRADNNPCYACIFPPEATFEEVRCATMGVFAPLVGIIGTVQAAEALKLLAGVGSSLAGRLQMLDARSMEWNEIRVARAPTCPVCAALRQGG